MAEKNLNSTSTTSTKNLARRNMRLSINHSSRRRIVQNYLLVWLDDNVATSSEDPQRTLEQLRGVVNEVNVFIEPEKCVTFLEGIQLEKVFLIASGSLGQDIIPRIHSMTHVDAIYILCGDNIRQEEWVKQWPKVQGVYTQIKHICQAVELAAKQCNQDFIAVSFPEVHVEGASDVNLNQLEPSFMYTQLFKKTLLDMEHDRKKEMQDLMKYCEEKYADNPVQLDLITEFGRDYHPNTAIWWYTRTVFIYQMLNRALRLLEADIIVNMGFFIHDLHRQIQQLHNEQVDQYGGKPFLVYRGQGLSTADFEKLNKSQGGLISFNFFLSTSRKKELSMVFTESVAVDRAKVGILFIMSIDPNLASGPYADAQNVSYFGEEAEILFSMHTVFRIHKITAMDEGRRHFEVNLTLTTDDDTQLRTLMDELDEDVQTSKGWERVGRLLIKVGQPNKAEELYFTLLDQTSTASDQGRYYHYLGYIKDAQGDYKEALRYYEIALEIREKILPTNHPDLANTYNNIGLVYKSMGEYSGALSYYERALEIRLNIFPAHHPDLATSYNNIGSVYKNMGEYSKALSYYEKDLEINQKSLSAYHPDLATSYNNIGLVYKSMGEYSKALSYYEKDLEINQKSLPAYHPDLATSYNNIGSVYKNMGEYSKALSYYEKDLEINQKSLSAYHPDLATSYNNIGSVYKNMGEYSKALSYYEKDLEINQKSLPANHPSLATSYNNIGSVYKSMGEYSKALSYYERALEIRQKILPTSHPYLLRVRGIMETLQLKLAKK